MKEERHPCSLTLYEVCCPCRSINLVTGLVDTYEALGESFQSCDTVLIRDQGVDHFLLEVWLLEVPDVENVWSRVIFNE